MVTHGSLREGDLVAIVSPASFPTPEHVDDMVDELESWGLRVRLGHHALANYGPMAGTDADRLADLNQALADNDVRAIFASRGGMGSYRIADGLDLKALRADPKPIIGFSDITNLLMAWTSAGVPSIHGCIGRHRGADDIRRFLLSGQTVTIEADPNGLTAPVRVAGTAQGTLLGGNLREVAGLVGVGLPSLDGAILFLEDLRHIGIGQIDRNLTQLLRSGALDRIGGIALGLFDGFDDYIDREWHLLDVLRDRLEALDVPVLGGIKTGHGGTDEEGHPEQRSLYFGSVATLDATNGTLRVGPCAAGSNDSPSS